MALRPLTSTVPKPVVPLVDRPFTPQQTYDQVLYELGLVEAHAHLTWPSSVERCRSQIKGRSARKNRRRSTPHTVSGRWIAL